MNNWCICWCLRIFLLGIWIFKGLTARRLYKSFGVKGLKQTLTQTHCYFQSTVRQSRITLSAHKNKHLVRSKTESYGCKTRWTDSEDGDTTACHSRKLFHLPFSVLSVRKIINMSSHVLIIIFFSSWETARSTPCGVIIKVYRSYTNIRTHLVGLLWKWSACRRCRCLHNIQHKSRKSTP
jgi:hypothetical protein